MRNTIPARKNLNFPPSSKDAVGALGAGRMTEASCKLSARELRLMGQAEISLTVFYRQVLLPWGKRQRFCFTAVSKGSAQPRWEPAT
jgi:hypothetical protein